MWAGWRVPWGLGLAFVLLHSLVDYPIQRQALGVFYFTLAGIVRGDDKLFTPEMSPAPPFFGDSP